MSSLTLETLTVLVIDDDELTRMTIANILRKNGCTVIEAHNGNEGLSLFQKENPHLVITDMLMPDKEGLETIADIRALNPATMVIAMSGGGSTQNMAFLKLSEKVGANRLMSKPIKPDELMHTVKSLMGV